MYKILNKEDLAPTVHLLQVEAPLVASKAQPGQFVMIMVDEKGERIPLTIADWDNKNGSVSIVVSEVGTTTGKLSRLKQGDSVAHFVGPLGKPADIGNFGNVVCVVMGYSMYTIAPVARALHEAGNKVHAIISAQTKTDLFGIERLRKVSDTLTVATSDGSFGEQGWVIEPLRRLLQEGQPINRAFVVGSVCMMKLVSAVTREFGIKTMVSLNPIMVDGTGMCGACRVSIGGNTRFACVDGPEFDGHEVDWDLLMARRCTYPVSLKEVATAYRCQSCGQW
ncbi:MAG: sulfide/dihydroorotate dehydrogenase-like FAD/NAD-binding protein [Dehalococcoidales bacterium]|nr:sulfide/dihydroorotate dehydrogenase-like FAD/NAD-binding protein [Dehalococcoidales bacterium]